MQYQSKPNMEERLLYYWSKLYYSQLKKGDDYKKLHKTIVILIANYELEGLKEIEKYHTKWRLREEDYVTKILTDIMEVHIIEIPKYTKNKERITNKELAIWLEFLVNPKSMEVEESMKTRQEIKEAREKLDEILADEELTRILDLEHKWACDYASDMSWKYDEGIEEGELKKTKKIAQKMKQKGYDIETISEILDITVKELEKLLKK